MKPILPTMQLAGRSAPKNRTGPWVGFPGSSLYGGNGADHQRIFRHGRRTAAPAVGVHGVKSGSTKSRFRSSASVAGWRPNGLLAYNSLAYDGTL